MDKLKVVAKRFFIIFLLIIIIFSAGITYAYLNKKEILSLVLIEIKKNINGEVKINDFAFGVQSFPRISLILYEVELCGIHFKKNEKELLKTKKVYINLEFWPLLNKKIEINSISIQNGNIFIFKTKNGYSNLEIFKKPKLSKLDKSSDRIILNLKKIKFIQIKTSFHDSLKNKMMDFNLEEIETKIKSDSNLIVFQLKGKLYTDSIMLNAKNGSFAKNTNFNAQINGNYKLVNKSLIIQNSSLKTKNDEIFLNALLDDSLYHLEFKSDNILYKNALLLLPLKTQKALNRYSCDQPINVFAKIDGLIKNSKQTKIDVDFEVKKSTVIAKNIKFNDVTLKGKFINFVNPQLKFTDENSQITLKNASFIKEGIPSTLTASIINLKKPFLILKSEINHDCKSLNEFLDNRKMKFVSGKYIIHIDYAGKLLEYLESKIDGKTGKLNGSIELKNVAFNWIIENQNYNNLNGYILFNENEVKIKKIDFLVNKNSFHLNGDIENYLPFFTNPIKKGYVKLEIYSPKIDLSTLLSKKKKVEKKIVTDSKSNKILSNIIDQIYEKLEFDLKVRINEFEFKKFRGKDLKADLVLANNKLNAKKLNVIVAGGEINSSLYVSDLDKDINPFHFKGKVNNTDIKDFFLLFNDFNQESVTHKNLDGKLSADVKFAAQVDEKLEIVPLSMNGSIDLKVLKGELNQFEPLKNMSNFLLKNRDFENVRFDDLTMKFNLKGKTLDISRMEIASNILNIFVEGRYDFGNATDFSVQIPLSNLKKRNKDFEPEKIGLDEKTGSSVFLHIFNDENGKTVIKYDPFKKHVKTVESKSKKEELEKGN